MKCPYCGDSDNITFICGCVPCCQSCNKTFNVINGKAIKETK